MKTYKGDLLSNGVNVVFGLIFIGILLGAGAVALAAMTPAAATNGVAAYNQTAFVIGNGSSGVLNLSTQLPTVGTIAGVGLILMVLFVALGYFAFRHAG